MFDGWSADVRDSDEFPDGSKTPTEIQLTKPELQIHVDENGKWPAIACGHPGRIPVTFAVSDGSFQMTVPWRTLPIVDLKKLNLRGAIKPDERGLQTLTTEAAQLLDHVALSDLHAEQNLALVAPVLSQSTAISGETSLWLEPMSIPLEGDKAMNPFPIRGLRRGPLASCDAQAGLGKTAGSSGRTVDGFGITG